MKPIIGVIPLFDEDRDSIWMVPGYMDGLREAGAIPLILPLHLGEEDLAQTDSLVDGYLFTGGHDVSPSLYGETPLPECGVSCPARDRLETAVFHRALAEDKPVFGICRGIQLINVLMGGTLYQDLPTQHADGSVEHHMTPPYDRSVHTVTIERSSPLWPIFETDTLAVNSYHHQAIRTLGKGLRVMATSEDGLIEGVYVPDRHFIWAIQWHPEFIYQKDKQQLALLNAFVQACEPHKNKG